jgi:hypothetical protein
MTPERSLDDARQRVDTLEAQVRENEAALGVLRRRLSYAEERAPFDGVVQRVHAHEGEFAATGQPLVELVALDGLKAVVQVPQVDAPFLRPGLPVRLEIQALAQSWQAEVDRVHPALDAGSRSATVAAFFPRRGRPVCVPAWPFWPTWSWRASNRQCASQRTRYTATVLIAGSTCWRKGLPGTGRCRSARHAPATLSSPGVWPPASM